LKRVLPYVRDALGLLGAMLIVRGVWLLSRPVAHIVAGVLLMTAILLLSKVESESE
jgi:hypothetical protein